MNKPHIVVLGAGYGGIMTIVKLQKLLGPNEATITLVNNNDYHYQTSLLHENAAGTVHHDRTRISIKEVVDLSKIRFILDKVVKIKPKLKKVKLKNGDLSYDLLVVALGSESAASDIPGMTEHSLTIDNLNNARGIREQIEYNFAMYHNDRVKNQARLNVVVAGEGLTGIELTGELANRIPELCREYDVDEDLVRVINIEEASSVMPSIDSQFADYAINSLAARGVEFVTDAMLKECRTDSVVYEKDGKTEMISACTIVWIARVRANSIVEASGFKTEEGKVPVQKDLRTPSFEDIFVLGDCSLTTDQETGLTLASTAKLAVQQASTVACNIKKLIRGDFSLDIFYFKPTKMAISLGANDGIGLTRSNRKLFGFRALIMRRLMDNYYLFLLGGFRLLMQKGRFNIFH